MDVLKKVGMFAAGTLFGTAGIKVLTSKDAKKVYANCTAAVLRANEERAAEEDIFEDEDVVEDEEGEEE